MFKIVMKCWSLIEPHARKKMLLFSMLSFSLNLLDIIGVALLGMVGSILARSIQEQGIGDRTARVLSIIGIENETARTQIIVLSLISLFFLIFKSICIYVITKKIFLFMSNQSNLISNRVIENILRQPLDKVRLRGSQEYIFIINRGTGHVTMGILGNLFTLMVDVSMLTCLIVLLLIADFDSGIVTLFVSVITIFTLHFLMKRKARLISNDLERLGIENNELVVEFFATFREVITRDVGTNYRDRIYRAKQRVSSLAAEMRMMPIFSKFAVEIIVLLGFLTIVLIQFSLNDPSRAIGNLVLFLAATSRITPAILRIQQGLITINNSIGASTSTREVLEEIPTQGDLRKSSLASKPLRDLVPKVTFVNVDFGYDANSNWAFRNINLEIEPHSFVGIVGPSGAGKSTFVDLLFGLIQPKKGEVLINDIPSREALRIWPGKFGYVSQTSRIVKGTILDNLLLGLDQSDELGLSAINALKMVGLWEFIESKPEGIHFRLSEDGSNLSGGQRQKLGIARALITKPTILVLDESTSQLDAQSEDSISSVLMDLKQRMTIVVIAHRLSTVRNADTLYYIEAGKIVSSGNFMELKERVSKFRKQTELLGF